MGGHEDFSILQEAINEIVQAIKQLNRHYLKFWASVFLLAQLVIQSELKEKL